MNISAIARYKIASLIQKILVKSNRVVNRVRYYDSFDYGPAKVVSNPRPLKKEILQEIIAFYEHFAPLYDGVKGPLRIEGAWRTILTERKPNVLSAIKTKNWEKYGELMSSMFRNEVIAGLWSICSFKDLDNLKDTHPEFLRTMDGFCFITGLDPNSIFCPTFGDPWGYACQNGTLIMTAGEHGVKAYNIVNLLNQFEQNKPLTLLDLGSGFGFDMAQVAKWYKGPLRIICLDIPVILTTAYAFISEHFLGASIHLIKTKEQLQSVLSTRQSNNIEFIFVPTLFTEEIAKHQIDIIHNHGSLAEMDPDTVDFYLNSLLTKTVRFFIEVNAARPINLIGSFTEMDSRQFPVPKQFNLISRSPQWSSPIGGRYLLSLYENKQLRS